MPGHLLNTTVLYGHRVAPGSRMNKQEYLSLMGVHNGPALYRAPVPRVWAWARTGGPESHSLVNTVCRHGLSVHSANL